MSNYKYTEEMVARMQEAGADGVTEDIIDTLVKEFNFNRRSVAAKFRSLNMEVPSKVEAPKFTADETQEFKDFVTSNSGELNAEEISQQFANGKFTARQVMGKALALELTSHVKKTEKKEKPKTYTADEEATITKMVGKGAFLEEIADALGKTTNSVRGKLLSMDLKAPQKNKKTPAAGGSYPELATLAPTMTVAELVAHYSTDTDVKTERGVKTALSRRNVASKDYQPKKAAA
jgi:hypothetical protein